MEDYELEEYNIGEWVGNGELEDFVYWLDNDEGFGYGYVYTRGDGMYCYNIGYCRELHTNNMIYEIR